MALLVKYCARTRWADKLTPITSAEQDDNKSTPGSLDVSAFRKKAERIARNVCKNLLTYCHAYSEPSGMRFIPRCDVV
jgi:hypothetical protein